MERAVLIQQNQVVTPGDFNNFGEFPRESLDHVVSDGITDGQGYVGFSVVESGPAEVTVAPGRYYENGKVFINDDDGGVTLDLSPNLAAVSKNIITVVAYGNPVDTETEPRTFLLDPITRATEGRVVSTVNLRRAEVSKIPGAENADPQPPAISSNQIAIAHVTVDTTGILSIEMVAANKLPSVKALNTRLVLVEKRLDQAGSAIDTIRTDISGLASQLRGKANQAFVLDLALDHARVKRLAELPDDYQAWSADNFSNTNYSDTEFSGYSAFVRDGLQFGNAGLARSALGLLNPLDSRISVSDNMVSARFDKTRRLSILGKDGEIALANYNVSSTNVVKLTRTRTEWVVSTNKYTPGNLDANQGWQVQRWGDTVDARRVNPQTGEEEQWLGSSWSTGQGRDPVTGEILTTTGYSWTHSILKTIEEPYFDAVTTTETVEGFQVGATFLNAQQGALAQVDLYFTRKAASGDVHLYITELDTAGRPDPSRVLYKVTKTPAQLTADLTGATPTAFVFDTTALVKGRRYGLWVVSQGSHFLATVLGNKYAQGQLFQKNNGDWVAAAGDVDLAFALWYAGYDQTRVEVQLNPVELAGGIGFLSINCDTHIPEGTSIIFEAQIGGVWKNIHAVNDDLTNALQTRPSLIQLRAVLIGTTDSMPAFGIGASRSSVTVRRNGTSMVHISTVRTPGASVDEIHVVLLARHWDSDDHTLTCKILTGVSYDTVETADTTVDLPVKLTPENLLARKFIFQLASGVTSYRIKIEGATTDVTNEFLVYERMDVAFAA